MQVFFYSGILFLQFIRQKYHFSQSAVYNRYPAGYVCTLIIKPNKNLNV